MRFGILELALHPSQIGHALRDELGIKLLHTSALATRGIYAAVGVKVGVSGRRPERTTAARYQET